MVFRRHSTSSWSYQGKESFPDICWNKFSAAVSKSLTPNRLWPCLAPVTCVHWVRWRQVLTVSRQMDLHLLPSFCRKDSGLPKVCLKLSNVVLVSSGYRAPVTGGFEFEVPRDSLRQRIPDDVQTFVHGMRDSCFKEVGRHQGPLVKAYLL